MKVTCDGGDGPGVQDLQTRCRGRRGLVCPCRDGRSLDARASTQIRRSTPVVDRRGAFVPCFSRSRSSGRFRRDATACLESINHSSAVDSFRVAASLRPTEVTTSLTIGRSSFWGAHRVPETSPKLILEPFSILELGVLGSIDQAGSRRPSSDRRGCRFPDHRPRAVDRDRRHEPLPRRRAALCACFT